MWYFGRAFTVLTHESAYSFVRFLGRISMVCAVVSTSGSDYTSINYDEIRFAVSAISMVVPAEVASKLP